MIGWLKVEAGFQSGRAFQLREGETFYIGRDKKNNYSIPLSQASRVHCKIENRGGTFSITDLQSKNGTFVNGERIESRPLRDGDVIEVARSRLRLTLEPETDEKTPPKSMPVIIAPQPRVMTTVSSPSAVLPRALAAEGLVFSDEERAYVGRLLGNVKLISAVYAGSRSRVFKGVESEKNRVVAVTMLPLALAENREAVRWFVEGCKRSGALRHEDALPILRGGREGKAYYHVTPYMEQQSAQVIFRKVAETARAVMDKAKHGHQALLLAKRALQAVIHVARALEHAHQHGVLHGGLRPTKILFNEYGIAKLAGLGFDNGPGPGFVADGPPAQYLAPEQKRPDGQVDHRSDIHSLGLTLYFMLTGRLPVRLPNGRVQSPRELNPAVPESVCRIVEKMIELDPGDRYLSYGHLLHDLRWVLRGESWPREE